MRGVLIGLIFSLLILPGIASATDWYVRPSVGSYGNEDGTSYNDAWDGLPNVVWGDGGVQAGDTLYVCGLHHRTYSGGSAWENIGPIPSGTGKDSRIIIRGDCPYNDQGIIWGSGVLSHASWTNVVDNVWSITLPGSHYIHLFFEDVTADSWTVLERVDNVTDCQNTAGSFYKDGSTLYVHCSDNGDPTDRISANRLGYNFQMNGAQYITFLNLKFYGLYRMFHDWGNKQIVSYITWDNCTLWYGETSILEFLSDDCHHILFDGCDVGWAANGLIFGRFSAAEYQNETAHDYTVRNCYIHDIGVLVTHRDAHCVGVQGGYNGLIEKNTCVNCGTGPLLYADAVTQEIKDTVIRWNFVRDCHSEVSTGYGITLNCDGTNTADKSGIEIYGNIVTNCTVGYRHKYEYLTPFYNNVAHNCDTSFRILRGTSATVAPHVKLRNSISLNPTTYHIRFESGVKPQGTYTIDSDYNIFYPISGDQFFFYDSDGGGNINFAEWQSLSKAGCTFDPNSITLNPLFEDPDNEDFHIQSNSPAIDNGTNVGLTLDFDGNTIPQPPGGDPDIGAYEYQGTGNVYYVRPAGGNYGREDGADYDNAWDGLLNVVWGSGGVQAGDTLYVCGFHLYNMTDATRCGSVANIIPQSGTGESARVTIRGDYPGDPGVVWGAYVMSYESWDYEENNTYSITLLAPHQPDFFFEDITPSSYTLLDPASSVQDCKDNAGTFYSPDYLLHSKLYVHCSDDEDPTGRIAANNFGYWFRVEGKEYITFLNTEMPATYRLMSNNMIACSHIKWDGVDVKYNTGNIISFGDDAHYNEVVNCDLSWATNGIYTHSTGNNAPSNYIFSNNTIHDIGVRTLTQNSDAHGIGIQGGSNGLIEDNYFYNCGSGVTLYAFTNQVMTNNVVRRNFVKDGHAYGGANNRGIETACSNPSLSNKSGNKFYNNIVMNVSIAYRFQWEDEQEIYNNVAYNCTKGLQCRRNYNGLGANVKLRNNIFLDNTDHIHWDESPTTYTINSDYNLFHPNTGDRFYHKEEGRDLTFAEWQSLSIPGSTFDPHSLTVDPLFLNPDNEDFHLQPGSPAIDAGVFVGLTKDLDGNLIPQGNGADIGAYEYLSGVYYIPGDLNNDGVVDIADLGIVAGDFGRTSGFDPRADVVPNNEIDIYDIVFVASRFT